MELYILRHGIAADVGQLGARNDAERPLTAEGRDRMEQASIGMRRMDLKLDQIVSSPLVRTRETAEIVAEALGAPLALAPELAPGCTLALLQEALRPYRNCERVLIVGHEPDCSFLAGTLIGTGRMLFKKGSLASIELNRLDSAGGTLRWLLTPALLRMLGTV